MNVSKVVSQEVLVDQELEKQLHKKSEECLHLMRRLYDRGVLSNFSIYLGRDLLTLEMDHFPKQNKHGGIN